MGWEKIFLIVFGVVILLIIDIVYISYYLERTIFKQDIIIRTTCEKIEQDTETTGRARLTMYYADGYVDHSSILLRIEEGENVEFKVAKNGERFHSKNFIRDLVIVFFILVIIMLPIRFYLLFSLLFIFNRKWEMKQRYWEDLIKKIIKWDDTN